MGVVWYDLPVHEAGWARGQRWSRFGAGGGRGVTRIVVGQGDGVVYSSSGSSLARKSYQPGASTSHADEGIGHSPRQRLIDPHRSADIPQIAAGGRRQGLTGEGVLVR